MDNNELISIEKELNVLVQKDRQNWSSFYLLLKRVETNKLWEGYYNSFTAWVKHFAEANKIQESVLWNRKKAGEVYQNYYAKKLEKKEKVDDIQSVEIAQDSLILIEKIARKDTELQKELIDKAINKELKKKDLQEAYRIVKSKRDEEKRLRDELKREDIAEEDKEKIKEDIKELKKSSITALDIVEALKSHTWLYKGSKETRKRFTDFYEQDKYKVFTEFPVFSGTTRHSRRIDALVCENLTEERWKLNLHAVEIKVSKSDLLNDYKYTEYADFTDFIWLAIPQELVEVAKETKLGNCGILVIKNGKVEVVEQAKRLDAIRKEECLSRLALKLL
ncbi:MAG: hypothetical protein ACLS90_05540 [Clostridia bacterium]